MRAGPLKAPQSQGVLICGVFGDFTKDLDNDVYGIHVADRMRIGAGYQGAATPLSVDVYQTRRCT